MTYLCLILLWESEPLGSFAARTSCCTPHGICETEQWWHTSLTVPFCCATLPQLDSILRCNRLSSRPSHLHRRYLGRQSNFINHLLIRPQFHAARGWMVSGRVDPKFDSSHNPMVHFQITYIDMPRRKKYLCALNRERPSRRRTVHRRSRTSTVATRYDIPTLRIGCHVWQSCEGRQGSSK